MDPVSASPSSKVTGNKLGLGILCTILGGVGWGFSGACAQFLFTNYGVDPRWVVCVRLAGAAVVFMILALAFDRASLRRAVTSPRGMWQIAVFSIMGVTLCMACYLNAINASNAGTATVLQALNLLIILVVVCIQLRRKPTKKEIVGVALAVAGTFLIATHGSFTSLAITPQGLAWGLATAVAAALYALLPAKPLSQYGSITVTGLAMVIGAACTWVAFRPWEMPVSLDAGGVAAVVGIILIGTTASYLLFLHGVKLVGSMLAGLFASTEPITASILSAAWLGTTFVPIDLLGMGMIVAMMFLMV